MGDSPEEGVETPTSEEAENKEEESENTQPKEEDKGVVKEDIKKDDGEKEQKPSDQPVPRQKIDIILKATADTPIMKQKKWAVEPDKKIGWIINFIRKMLKMGSSESVFLYVNQAFAPPPDHTIHNLYECFGSDGRLTLHYCKTQAWG